MGLFSFEKLNVWRDSQLFTREIYSLVNSFPKAEEFGLKAQIKRASISISLNLAEGSGRKRGKEQARFYSYAFSSLLEVTSGLYLAEALGYTSLKEIERLRPIIERIAKQISGLRNYTMNEKT